jgi:hypothetical protein
VLDAGNLDQITSKIFELSPKTQNALSDGEVKALQTLLQTLKNYSMYHASSIDESAFIALKKALAWLPPNRFPGTNLCKKIDFSFSHLLLLSFLHSFGFAAVK